jgi:hypothetical protein
MANLILKDIMAGQLSYFKYRNTARKLANQPRIIAPKISPPKTASRKSGGTGNSGISPKNEWRKGVS